MARSAAQLDLLKLRSRLQGWLRDRNSRAKSYGCPDSEPCRVMRDIGVRGRDLNAPECSHPGPSELMPQRLERVGLDPGYVKSFHESIYQDLQRVCASCKGWRLCARDLAKGDVQTGMGAYCLYAVTIDALLIERPQWVPSIRKC
jgi:hypothetical protein